MYRKSQCPTVLAAALLAAACSDRNPAAPATTVATAPPEFRAAADVIPVSAVSAQVAFAVDLADSARVVYRAIGVPSDATPFRTAASVAHADTVLLLGLRPGTDYECWVEATGPGGTRTSTVTTFRTGDLPDPLVGMRLDPLSGGMPRYALTGFGSFAVAFDSSGSVVWYKDFTSTGLPVSNVLRQPNGNFTAFLGTSTGWQPVPGYYVEFTPSGDIVRTYAAPSGTYVDDHDLQLTGQGAAMRAHLFTYSVRDLDMTEFGGGSDVSVAGHQIVRTDAAGHVEFFWDAWAHLTPDEWLGDADAKQRASTDYDHPNALTFDQTGNYVVSWRNLNQVMAIDSRTGDILWRLGGMKSDFQFVGDAAGGFSKQHSVKVLANGNLLVYDNGTDHDPQETRVAEYRLDAAAKTATLVWEYHHDPAIYTPFVGWVERLANGDTWIAYANVGRVVEVDPGGHVVWESQLHYYGANAPAYRIVPVATLY